MSVSFVESGGVSAAAALTSSNALSQQDGSVTSPQSAQQLRRAEFHAALTVAWATGCLLTKQFAVSLVQTCPNGAHDLKSIFYNDFDDYVEALAEKQNQQHSTGSKNSTAAMQPTLAAPRAKSRWNRLADKRNEVVATMAGFLQPDAPGEFIDPSEGGGATGGASDDEDDECNDASFTKVHSADVQSTGIRAHVLKFDNLAAHMMRRKAARKLVSLDTPTFVIRAVRLLNALGLVSFTAEELDMKPVLEALQYRQIDGPGLRVPFSDTEDPRDYLSEDEEEAAVKTSGGAASWKRRKKEQMDADAQFRIQKNEDRKQLKRWEREVRERWYVLRDVSAIEGQLHYFSGITTLSYSLLDLFWGAFAPTTSNTAHQMIQWSQLVEFLGDCGCAGGSNAASGEDAAAGSASSDMVARAMLEEVHSIPFPELSRNAMLVPWTARNLLITYEMDRDETERFSMFDASVLRPNRVFVWPSHYGRVSQVVVAANLNALLVSTFDVVRVVDADNYMCKFVFRVEDPITALQWVAESQHMILGTRAGSVYAFRLATLDSLFFGGGSQVVRELPDAEVKIRRLLHTDALTHISSTMLPGTTCVSSSMDGSLACWSLESNVVRRMGGAVALGFELLSGLGLIFAYGVELFPMLWSYTVANSKPVVVGGKSKGIKPHQARIIGVAALSYPKNSGFSLDRLGGIMVWDLWENVLLQSWCILDHIPATLSTRGMTFSNYYLANNRQGMFVASHKLLCQVNFLKQEDSRRAPVASNFPIQCLAHCPELRLFVSAQKNNITLWNAVTAAPIMSYDNVSPEPRDEILVMQVYETPNREIRVGTKCGLVVTLGLGNGSVKSVYRHPSKRDVQCILYIPLLELLVMSCEGSAKSILLGEEKSFFLMGDRSVGFSDVCVHNATTLLVAAHDNEPRVTVWDVSPTTPNVWVRLADMAVPEAYLDKTLLMKSTDSSEKEVDESGGEASSKKSAAIGCARLEDLRGTICFVMADTASQLYVCDINVALDDGNATGFNAGQKKATAQYNSSRSRDAVGGDADDDSSNDGNELQRYHRAKMRDRRKSTLYRRCEVADGLEEVPSLSTVAPDDDLIEVFSDGGSDGPISNNASARDLTAQRRKSTTRKKNKSDAVRIVTVTVRQIFSHRLHATQGIGGVIKGDVLNFVPSVTAMKFTDRFGLLYVADDLGYVSVYDIADVLLQCIAISAAPSPDARSLVSSAESGISGQYSSRESSCGKRMKKTVSNVDTTFANTKPTNINEPILAERIWGKTDMPFTKTLDDRLAEYSEVFEEFVPGANTNASKAKRRKKRREDATSDDFSSESSSTASGVFQPQSTRNDFLIDFTSGAYEFEKPLVALSTPSSSEATSPLAPSLGATTAIAAGSTPPLASFVRVEVPSSRRSQPNNGLDNTVFVVPSCFSALEQSLGQSTSGGPLGKSATGVRSQQHRVRLVSGAAPSLIMNPSPNAGMLGASSTLPPDGNGWSRRSTLPPVEDDEEESLRPKFMGVSPKAAVAPSRRRRTTTTTTPHPAATYVVSPKSAAGARFAQAATKAQSAAAEPVVSIVSPTAAQQRSLATERSSAAWPIKQPETATRRRHSSYKPVEERPVVCLLGSVYLVHRAEVHPNHAVTSLLVLDAPITSIATCGKDKQIVLWTLFLSQTGRLGLSPDNQIPLYAKFKSMASSVRPDVPQAEASRRRSKSMAKLSSSVSSSARNEWQDWETIFGMRGDRLSIFDDVPKRFRVLRRNPATDWQAEVERLLDMGGSTIGGGGAVQDDDDDDQDREKVPLMPVLVNRDALLRQVLPVADEARDTGLLQSLTGGRDTPPTGSSTLHDDSKVSDGASDATRSFFLTSADSFTPPVSPREKSVAQIEAPVAQWRVPKVTADTLRLTHEQRVVLCQDWFYGRSLSLHGERLVDRVLALKRLGDVKMDDVVNEVLWEREQAQDAADAARASAAAVLHNPPLVETAEMKALFLSTLPQGAASAASANAESSGSMMNSSPVIVVGDGEVLDPSDERLTAHLKPREQRSDEAWLSRVVLRQLEPRKDFLPIPTTVKIESKLEEKNTRASSPPHVSGAVAKIARESATHKAFYDYKERLLYEEMRSDDQAQRDLGSISGMAGARFLEEVVDRHRLLAVKDRVKHQNLERHSRTTALPAIATRSPMWQKPLDRTVTGHSSTVSSKRSAGGTQSMCKQHKLTQKCPPTSNTPPPQRSSTSFSALSTSNISMRSNTPAYSVSSAEQDYVTQLATPVQLSRR